MYIIVDNIANILKPSNMYKVLFIIEFAFLKLEIRLIIANVNIDITILSFKLS